MLKTSGVLAATPAATLASLSPMSPSTPTVTSLPVLVEMTVAASKLSSSPFGATYTDGGISCGNTGHFARDCPEPRKQSGDCFNCGQPG